MKSIVAALLFSAVVLADESATTDVTSSDYDGSADKSADSSAKTWDTTINHEDDKMMTHDKDDHDKMDDGDDDHYGMHRGGYAWNSNNNHYGGSDWDNQRDYDDDDHQQWSTNHGSVDDKDKDYSSSGGADWDTSSIVDAADDDHTYTDAEGRSASSSGKSSSGGSNGKSSSNGGHGVNGGWSRGHGDRAYDRNWDNHSGRRWRDNDRWCDDKDGYCGAGWDMDYDYHDDDFHSGTHRGGRKNGWGRGRGSRGGRRDGKGHESMWDNDYDDYDSDYDDDSYDHDDHWQH